MSDTTTKIRGLFLAALMVTSVIAFAGGASAAVTDVTVTDATNVSEDQELTKQKVSFTATTDDTANNLTVNVSGIGGGAEVTDVSVSGFSVDGETTYNDNGTITMTDVDGVSTGTNHLTLTYNTEDVTSADGTPTVAISSTADETINGSAEFSLIDADAVDTFADGGTTVWAGQNVYFEGDQNTVYEVHQVTGDDNDQVGTLVSQFNTGGDAVYVFNSDNFEVGEDYIVTNSNGEVVELNDLGVSQGVSGADNPVSTESWGVTEQTLSAEWDDDEVTNDDAPSATTYAEIDSNRADYDVTVSANGLDVDELEQIFAEAENDGDNFEGQNVIASDDDDETITLGVGGDTDLYGDFTEIDADDYQFTFEGADTTASATANISVIEDEGGLSLDQGTVAEERGDVANFTVNLDNTDNGYVQIGSEDVGYNATVEVDDGGDGQVELQMNTFYAGGWSDDGVDVFTLTEDSEDDDDTIENVWVHSDELDSPLEAGTYDIAVAAEGADADPGFTVEDEDDLGTLDLQERGTEGIQIWTAPGNADVGEEEELLQVVNQTQEIAGGSGQNVADYAVVQLSATGIYGQIEGDDISALDDNANLVIEQADPGPNQEAEELDLTDAANTAETFVDAENDTLYVVVDTNDWDEFETDEDYTAHWELLGSSPLVDDDDDVDDDDAAEEASADFSLAEPEVEFDNLNDNDELQVPASESATVSGTTNIAPGSDVTLRVRSTEDGQAFLKTADATVGQNGSFSATVDMSNVETGTEFTAELRRGGQVIGGEDVDGVVVEAVETETPGETATPGETTTPGETAAPGETTTPGEDTTTATDTTTTDGDTTAATETTTEDTPGFGVVVALVALVAAALLAVRRDN